MLQAFSYIFASRRARLGGALLLLVAAAACRDSTPEAGAAQRAQGAPRGPNAGQGGMGGRGGAGGRANRIVPIEMAVAELGTAARSIAATGSVQPIRTIGVNSQLAGALTAVTVEEGDHVRQGAVLARIDVPEIRAQLRSAEAALEAARRAAQRADELRRQQIITVAEHEREQTALAAARATRDALASRLAYATVRAPATGVVLEKRVERGDIVGAQQRLFAIGDVSTLVVTVQVSELEVARLREGDPVGIALDAVPGRPLDGRIRRIFPRADTLTRLVPVEVALSTTAAQAARPGYLARVSFQLDPRANVLLVPAAAVLADPEGSVVYVVRDGKAERRRVERGATYSGRIEIVNGLAAGDTVAVAGNNQLRDGSQVRAVSSPAPVDAPAPGDRGTPLRTTPAPRGS